LELFQNFFFRTLLSFLGESGCKDKTSFSNRQIFWGLFSKLFQNPASEWPFGLFSNAVAKVATFFDSANI